MKIKPNAFIQLNEPASTWVFNEYGFDCHCRVELIEFPPHHRTLKTYSNYDDIYRRRYKKIPFTQFYFASTFYRDDPIVIVTNSSKSIYSDNYTLLHPMFTNCNMFGYGIGVCFDGIKFDSPGEAIDLFWSTEFLDPGLHESINKSDLQILRLDKT